MFTVLEKCNPKSYLSTSAWNSWSNSLYPADSISNHILIILILFSVLKLATIRKKLQVSYAYRSFSIQQKVNVSTHIISSKIRHFLTAAALGDSAVLSHGKPYYYINGSCKDFIITRPSFLLLHLLLQSLRQTLHPVCPGYHTNQVQHPKKHEKNQDSANIWQSPTILT